MTTYYPDRWAILEFAHPSKPDHTIRKVLGGWYGGYAKGDSWRLSSGVTKCVVDKNPMLFHNHSGSTYVCYKGKQGFSMTMMSEYQHWCETAAREGFTVTDVTDEYVQSNS